MLDLNAGISAVKFGATWCPPCKTLGKTLGKMESEFPTIRFLSIDIDDEPTQAKDYRIRAVPTVILFRDGQEINRIVGGNVKISALRKLFGDIAKAIAA
jgi:thioredoxin 1